MPTPVYRSPSLKDQIYSMTVKERFILYKTGMKQLKHTNLQYKKGQILRMFLTNIANNFHVNDQVSEFYAVWGMVYFLCKKT